MTTILSVLFALLAVVTPSATPSGSATPGANAVISSTLSGPGLSLFSEIDSSDVFLYQGPSIQGSVPFVFQNTGAETAYRVQVTGTARSKEGTLIGVASTSTVVPAAVKPGEIGIGKTYFGSDLPEDASVELKATYDKTNGEGYLPQFDLNVNEVGSDGDNLIGTATNDSLWTLQFIGVDGICLNDAGVAIGYLGGVGVDDRVKTGASTAFKTTLYQNFDSAISGDPLEICPNYIIGVTGLVPD